MSHTRDLINEILEIRGRRKFDLATQELFTRLSNLDEVFNKSKSLDRELHKYFPVALVALMENYFRLCIKELVDHGEPFFSNAEALFAGNKLTFDLLKGLHKKQITVGELVAHTVQLNNLTQINTGITKLISKEFLKELRTIYDRFEHEVKGKPNDPILKDPDTIFAHVARTFELRHIICHESPTNFEIDFKEIEQGFLSTTLFLKAADEFVSQIRFPDAPLTQTDMNIAADADLKKTLGELETIQNQIRLKLQADCIAEFDKTNAVWKEFMERWAQFAADFYKGGTISPMIYATTANTLAEARLEYLNDYITYLDI